MATELDGSLITMLRDSAQDVLQHHSLSRLRGWIAKPRPVDMSVWKAISDMGWTGLMLPEALGGSGLDVRYACELCEIMGQHLLCEPFIACSVMPSVVIGYLPQEDACLLSEVLRSGERLIALAWQEMPGQVDTLPCGAELKNGRLYGRKVFVVGYEASSILLVSATENGQPVWVTLEANAPGVSVRHYAVGNGKQTDITFSGAPMLCATPLLKGDAALTAWQECLAVGRITQAAYSNGQTTGCLQKTLDYVSERKQFSRPIGAFQSVQHRCVDMSIGQHLGDAGWRHAAQQHVQSPLTAMTESAISAAKARNAQVALDTARLAVQLHGAMGFAEESNIGLYLRAAISDSAWLGSVWAHRRRFVSRREHLVTPIPAAEPFATEDPRDWSDTYFRARLRAWLVDHYPASLRQDDRRPFLRLRGEDQVNWLRCLLQHGWRAPAWPREYGGMGISFAKQMIYQQEMERAGVARIIDNGETQLGPTIIKYGTQAQKDWYLPRILSCDDMWCQGYSEPGAGSDLASLGTRARRAGDEFVVDGQKIWSTHAKDCSHIYALVRTGTFERKQQGISFLLIDLNSPGVTIRPIANIAGEDEFCEVFFDSVRVPVTQLVGPLDEGWSIAKSLLGHERIWLGSPAMALRALDLSERLVAALALQNDAGITDRLAILQVDMHDYLRLYNSICDQVSQNGRDPGPSVSMLKVYVGELLQRVTEFCIEIADEAGAVVGDTNICGIATDLHWMRMMSLPVTIYAGANEVQRDILARTILGMPSIR